MKIATNKKYILKNKNKRNNQTKPILKFYMMENICFYAKKHKPAVIIKNSNQELSILFIKNKMEFYNQEN